MAASQVVAVTLRGVVCGVRCVPGQFDSRLRAYLDRWILALSFAVGRWHFQRSETRDALCSSLAGLVVGGCDWACACRNGS
jgi:hypothetical protein